MQGVQPAANAMPTSAEPEKADGLALEVYAALLAEPAGSDDAETEQAEKNNENRRRPAAATPGSS